MRFLKALVRGLASLGFKFCLTVLAFLGALAVVIANPAGLKQALHNSKIYQPASSQLAKQVTEKGGGDNNISQNNQPPQQQPELKQAAEQALSPAFLESTTNQIIDSLYNWLSGKTPQPQFSIDASSVKQAFVKAAGDAAVTHAQQLPVCTAQQLRQINPNDIDPFNTPCLPKGFDINSLRTQAADQADKGGGDNNFLKNPVITPDNLPKDDKGKTPVENITDKAHNAPKFYQWFKRAPLLFGLAAVILAATVVLLSDDKRRGLRSLAVTLTGVGLLLLLSIFIFSYAQRRLEAPNGPLQNLDQTWTQPVLGIIHSLGHAFTNRLLIYGIVYAVVGIGGLIALRLTRPTPAEEAVKDAAGEPALHQTGEKDDMLPEPVSELETKPDEHPKKKKS